MKVTLNVAHIGSTLAIILAFIILPSGFFLEFVACGGATFDYCVWPDFGFSYGLSLSFLILAGALAYQARKKLLNERSRKWRLIEALSLTYLGLNVLYVPASLIELGELLHRWDQGTHPGYLIDALSEIPWLAALIWGAVAYAILRTRGSRESRTPSAQEQRG